MSMYLFNKFDFLFPWKYYGFFNYHKFFTFKIKKILSIHTAMTNFIRIFSKFPFQLLKKEK